MWDEAYLSLSGAQLEELAVLTGELGIENLPHLAESVRAGIHLSMHKTRYQNVASSIWRTSGAYSKC